MAKADLAIVFGGKPKGPHGPGGVGPDDMDDMGSEDSEEEDEFDSAASELFDAAKSDDLEGFKDALYRAIGACKD